MEKSTTVWTKFHDMHSGGGRKLEWESIYIEAPEGEAAVIFQNAFGRNPHRVTCTCCGEDYSLDESASLAQASGYERNCRTLVTPRLPDGRYDNNNPVLKAHLYLEGCEEPPPGFEVDSFRRVARVAYIPLAEYVKRPEVKIIPASEIRPEWRKGELRQEGFVG